MKSFNKKYEDLLDQIQDLRVNIANMSLNVFAVRDDVDTSNEVSESFDEQADYLKEVGTLLGVAEQQLRFAKDAIPKGVTIYVQ